jgi:hypothetical protein
VTATLRWADETDPLAQRMIFVSATAATRDQGQLVTAWDLYEGGCLPQLRERLAEHPRHRGRVRLVSAEYGLLHPHTSVPPTSREMTEVLAHQLRPRARDMLLEEFARYGVPRDVMLLIEHPYHHVVRDLFQIPGLKPRVSLSDANPGEHWPLVAAVLDRWGWP